MTETTTTKPAKIEQHGVSRPGPGTATARVWEIADQESAKLGAPVGRAVVLEQARKEEINEATAATQYGRWRTFNGLARAVPAPKPAKATTETESVKESGKGKKGAAAAATVE